MILDAHLHLWQRATGLYGWIPRDEPALSRDVLPGELDRVLAAHGVAGGFLVQAADSEEEVPFLSAAVRELPNLRGYVAPLDLTRPGAAARVAGLATDPALRGFRPPFRLTETAEGVAALAEIACRGLVCDALLRPTDLGAALRLARRHPGLRLVIDHAANPNLPDPGADWAAGMRALASAPKVAVKLSGLMTRLAPGADPATIRPLILRLVDWFGPDRLLWGSDWPVMTRRSDYGQWLDLCQDAVTWLGAADRAAIFGTSAMHLYGVADHDKPLA